MQDADRRQPRHASASATLSAQLSDRLTELLQHSARGDQEAFAELYDATASRSYGLTLRMLDESDDQATEVTQEVFVEIWRSCRRFDDANPMAWMLIIAHRRAADRVRTMPRRPSV